MKSGLLRIASILLLTLLVITPAGQAKSAGSWMSHTEESSAGEGFVYPYRPAQPSVDEEAGGTPSEPFDTVDSPGAPLSVPAGVETAQLFPEHMDPITTCQTSLGGPFGKDVEIFMGGDVGYRIDVSSGWMVGAAIPDSVSISNISAVAAGSEKIVATWKDSSGSVWYDLWRTSETHPGGAWVGSVDLGFQADGDPAVIARSANQWEVYAHQGDKLFTTILTDTYRAATLPWQQIEGVSNAASDPVVVAVSPHHKALFYLDGSGHTWYTEWTAGWGWRDQPIPLVDNWLTYLPVVTAVQPGGQGRPENPLVPESGSGVQRQAQNFQFLNAIARNENHMAVFAVDAENQLWVRQWARSSSDGWSGTQWLMIMQGVALEKPAAASRHSNHIGVAVRDTAGNPVYIGWSQVTGWAPPQLIPRPNGSLSAGLTLAAPGTDAYWLFGADQAGQIGKINWNEDTGWGTWETIGSGMAPDQVLAAASRRFMDVMVLGREAGGQVNNLHYTSQDGEITSTEMVPQRSSAYLPRGQTLAWVNGSVFHLAGRQSDLGPPHFWEVEAREMVETAPLTGTLLLGNHDFLNYNALSLAAGDLDFDGSDEVVIVTRSGLVNSLSNEMKLSVVDIESGTSLVMRRLVSRVLPPDMGDFSVKIGDLDGNGRRDEIVVSVVDEEVGVNGYVYRYSPESQQLDEIYQGLLLPFSEPESSAEVEIAIGRLYPRNPSAAPSQQYLGEQLILLNTIIDWSVLISNLSTFTLNTGTGELEQVDFYQLGNSLCNSCHVNDYRSALDAGDLDADGYDEIAAWTGFLLTIKDPRSGYQESDTFDLITEDWYTVQSLSVGDIDLDGRAEILAGSKQYLSIFEILGDDRLSRTRYQEWEPTWGNASAVLAGDLDHDTFASELVGCETFREARIAVVVNGAPRWYVAGAPIQNSSGKFSLSRGGSYTTDTGTSHSWGNTVEIGSWTPINVPFLGEVGELRTSLTLDYLGTVGETTTRENEEIYGTDYTFDDTSLGLVILNVRSYTCSYYDIYLPEEPQSTSRAMVCSPEQHVKEFHSLDWWLTSGNQGDFEYSWAEVGHKSPGGVHTNSLQEPRNYESSLPVGYRVVYNWSGADIPNICGDQYPQSVEWWAEDADGYSEGTEFSVEENISISAGWSMIGYSMDVTESLGEGWSESETFGWKQTVGFSGGITSFFDDPTDPGDDRPCYRIVPYVYQATAQTLGGFTYPYLELDYYVECIGTCGHRVAPEDLDAARPR